MKPFTIIAIVGGDGIEFDSALNKLPTLEAIILEFITNEKKFIQYAHSYYYEENGVRVLLHAGERHHYPNRSIYRSKP